MYKVLIVDDEEPLREAIRILGDWKGLGVEEVLEATDGNSALAVLRQEKIDLVMVDMKMPELSGMDFLRIVERDYPDLLTIVISGYNDFEYTRQAIRSKVIDYLLKPVNRQDLNHALYKANDLIEAKRRSESEFITTNITLNMSLPKLKEKIYLSIIERSFKKQTNEAFLPLIGADDPDNRFGAVVLRVLNLEKIKNSRFNRDTDLLYFAIANVLGEITDKQLQCFSFANPRLEREMIAIYTMEGGYPQDLAFKLAHLGKKAAAALNELFGMHVAAGVGSACRDAIEIAGSYEAAKAAINAIDLLKLNGLTVANYSDKPAASDIHSITGRFPVIRAALEAGHVNHAKNILGEYTKKLKASGFFSLGDADRNIHELVILLNDMAIELNISGDKLPAGGSGLRSAGISTDFADFGQFEALMNHILEYYGEQIRSAASANRRFDAGDLKAYIEDHYYEDIKISMFTEKYFMSREYLMRLFKQQFGFGIHEYVQKVRMDKAKELLGDDSLKIQDISEMLGYKDKNYFSKAFRNFYSISPSEYRANLRGG